MLRFSILCFRAESTRKEKTEKEVRGDHIRGCWVNHSSHWHLRKEELKDMI